MEQNERMSAADSDSYASQGLKAKRNLRGVSRPRRREIPVEGGPA